MKPCDVQVTSTAQLLCHAAIVQFVAESVPNSHLVPSHTAPVPQLAVAVTCFDINIKKEARLLKA